MLTDKTIKAAISAVTSEATLNDGAANGRGSGSLMLVIRRLANGTVSAQWFARWKRDGKRQKKALGRYPEITLAIARQMMATELAPLIRSGKSPAMASSIAGQPTVRAMFQAYIDSMKEKGRASASEVERMLLLADYNAADTLGSGRHPGDVEAADVAAYVAKFYRAGHRGAADKARAYVSAAYGWAKRAANDYTNQDRRDWGVRHNPAEDVQKDSGATKTRDRNLSASDLAAVWRAVDGEGFELETGSCVRLLICTGQRVQETLRMDASEVDLDARLWTIPAEKTKLGLRPHVVPLTSQAVDVLRRLLEAHPEGPLFPSRAGAKGPLMQYSSVRQALSRWLAGDGQGVEFFTTRDLRRTWKSRAGDAGVDRFTRDLIQQHAKGDTGSKHYDRYEYLAEKRAAMAKWEAWLAGVLDDGESLHVKAAA